MNVLIWILTFVHVIVALVLILLVLMQKSQDQGVGAAFGGGMTETVFGAGTTTALVRMTIWCAAIMLGTTLLLAVLHSRRSHTGESLGSKVLNAAPAAPSMPNAAPSAMPNIAPALPPVEPTPVAPVPSEAKP